jgi:hypothetical protein
MKWWPQAHLGFHDPFSSPAYRSFADYSGYSQRARCLHAVSASPKIAVPMCARRKLMVTRRDVLANTISGAALGLVRGFIRPLPSSQRPMAISRSSVGSRRKKGRTARSKLPRVAAAPNRPHRRGRPWPRSSMGRHRPSWTASPSPCLPAKGPVPDSSNASQGDLGAGAA